MIWMIDNQMGRRNITTAAKIRLAMKKHAFLSATAKERKWSGKKSDLPENLPEGVSKKGGVRDLIGKDAGVSKTMETTQPFMAIQFRNNSHNDPSA